jgi:hypothetical protein
MQDLVQVTITVKGPWLWSEAELDRACEIIGDVLDGIDFEALVRQKLNERTKLEGLQIEVE